MFQSVQRRTNGQGSAPGVNLAPLMDMVFILLIVRTFKGLGRWWGAVAIISGALLLLLSISLTDSVNAALTNARANTAADTLTPLETSLIDTVVTAINENANTPLLIVGIVLLGSGIVFLVATFVLPRRRTSLDRDEDTGIGLKVKENAQ